MIKDLLRIVPVRVALAVALAVANAPFSGVAKPVRFRAPMRRKSTIKTPKLFSALYPNVEKSSPAVSPLFPQKSSANCRGRLKELVSWPFCRMFSNRRQGYEFVIQ